MKKERSKNDIPRWLKTAMHGVVCWIGWQRAHHNYHLVEAAIVSEMQNLIKANLGDGKELIREIMYKKINSDFPIGKATRADLAIQKTEKNCITHVIEVKRSSSSKILEDVERLGSLKKLNPEIKAYLLIVSEHKRPQEYVTENGCKMKKKFKQKEYEYEVRRVVKMSHAFTKKEHAHYACVLEVV